MSKLKKIIIFFCVICSILNADIKQVYNFSWDKITVRQVMGFDQIIYKNLLLSDEVGMPQLPFKLVHVSLESDEIIDDIILKNVKHEKLDQKFNIFPAQKPEILSTSKRILFNSQISKYSQSDICPTNIIEILKSGQLKGNNICSFKIYPLKYLIKEKELIFYEQIELEIITKKTHQKLKTNPFNTSNTFNKIIKSMTGELETRVLRTENSEISKYIIITSDNLRPCFEPLRNWKHKKGLSAEIVTTEWIKNNYSGVDLQEKIRNCIKNYYQDRSTEYVLLGGDTDVVPDRKAWAFDCEYGSYTNNMIPCDLYYSDLDGNWNADGDGIYGELDDNIDMYPDVLVGRAPVENADEANAFVDKLLTYEKTANNHELNILFLGQVLWKDPYTDSGISMDFIDNEYVPDRFDPITKLYESLGNETKSNVINAINNGQNIINHDGHAWHSTMSVANGGLNNADMNAFTNKNKYSTLYSIGCWPAAIDYDAVAEHFVTNPNGGGVAFVGNSRYGWGSPGNPLYGYSDRFNHQFYKKLFVENITNVGATMAAAKSEFVSLSQQENVYRWCEYEINLLGDPEMMIWTDIPVALQIVSPDYLVVGENNFSVFAEKEGVPVSNSLICIYQEDEFYKTAYTDINGIGVFDISIVDAAKPVHLTITAQNGIPYEDTIDIQSAAPFISAKNISDSGFFRHKALINENILLYAVFKNYGLEAANNLTITIDSDNPKINIINGSLNITQIAALDSVCMCDVFTFQVKDHFKNDESFLFNLTASDLSGNIWKSNFSLVAKLPDLVITETSFTGENVNGNIQPGESVQCKLSIVNQGLMNSEKYSVNVTADANLTVSNISFENNGLSVQQIDSAIIDFNVNINTITPAFLNLYVEFLTDSSYSMCDTISVGIGNFGFIDNVETSNQLWTTIGESNQWHKSTIRKNSGQYSWYCGNESIQEYEYKFNNIIESDQFYLGDNSELKFSCWYIFPNYGTSGMYVEINNNDQWETLDFIGSGGALGTLPTGNDWLDYQYDLSHLPKDKQVALRFRVDIDSTQIPTEGIYVDDIVVGNTPIFVTDTIDEIILEYFELYQNYPNPFNPFTNIKFTIPERTNINLSVYNIKGELVSSLANRDFLPGTHSLKWDATNFGSGIYFYKIKTGKNQVLTKKCLLIK